MAHKKLEFAMPASEAVVFDAFHYHHWRLRWDSLVRATSVQGGAPCPFKGAVTESAGAGLLRGLSMRTVFVSYNRPHLAAAAMVGHAFPFTQWAASMRHRATVPGQSVLVYTYTLEVGPSVVRWLIGPLVEAVFYWQTRRRFARLHRFLARHAGEVQQWQLDQAVLSVTGQTLGAS
ncbi:hypothetical protein [Rhodoferax sp.]|uniref:hypothetical protein n=1 Tax=Rhodoferax sp. TaxID=50421 RepID=UPI00374D1A30